MLDCAEKELILEHKSCELTTFLRVFYYKDELKYYFIFYCPNQLRRIGLHKHNIEAGTEMPNP